MKPKTNTIKDAEIIEEKSLVPTSGSELAFDPIKDTEKAKKAADALNKIIRGSDKGKYIVRINGQSEHAKFEAWQTIAAYYHCSVDTSFRDPKYVEYGNAKGFEAYARVINWDTGNQVGGATALCMNDEYNWKTKPSFQLQSMAQTRAGSKALRDTFGHVLVLAGYNPTPAEEMDSSVTSQNRQQHKPYVGDNGYTHEPVEESENANSDVDILDRHCAVCQQNLSELVYLYSVNHFKKPLCMTHQKMQ